MKSTILLLHVFEKNYKALFRIVYAITCNVEDTLDILQETFLRAYMRYNSYRSKEDTLKFLVALSKNTAIAYKKNTTIESVEMAHKIGATDIPSLDMFLLELKALGSTMPIEMFNYLMMNILGGVPLLEISRKSKIPFERLIHWKKIVLTELSHWFKYNL